MAACSNAQFEARDDRPMGWGTINLTPQQPVSQPRANIRSLDSFALTEWRVFAQNKRNGAQPHLTLSRSVVPADVAASYGGVGCSRAVAVAVAVRLQKLKALEKEEEKEEKKKRLEIRRARAVIFIEGGSEKEDRKRQRCIASLSYMYLAHLPARTILSHS